MKNFDLDQLFRKKLEEYDQTPPEAVWDRISASLDKKKRRRIIPIWWQLGGVAAALILGLLLYNPFSGNLEREFPEQPLTESPQNPLESEKSNALDPQTIDTVPETVITENSDREMPRKEQQESGVSPAQPIFSSGNQNGVATQNTNRYSKVNTPENPLYNSTKQPTPELSEIVENKTLKSAVLKDNSEAGIAVKENADASQLSIPRSKDVEQNMETAVAGQTAQDGKSIFDEIQKQEKIKEDKTSQGRWAVGASVAPVYFNSLGEGSPIHSSFAANSKTGTVNLSYGVNLSYQVSKRLSVRSGVHRVDYGYSTEDVAFAPTFNASSSSLIRTISYSENSRNIVVQSARDNTALQNDALANDVSVESPQRQGSMLQQFGYLEVPLELQYKLVDQRLGVDVIAGMSSLFLVDNALSLESEGTTTSVGEATNMNDMNFSTNVGLGVNYGFTKNMNLHLQPMFKLQLNTFSETAGDFRPYSFGVYSGVTFKF